jgi:hypothetical protein
LGQDRVPGDAFSGNFEPKSHEIDIGIRIILVMKTLRYLSVLNHQCKFNESCKASASLLMSNIGLYGSNYQWIIFALIFCLECLAKCFQFGCISNPNTKKNMSTHSFSISKFEITSCPFRAFLHMTCPPYLSHTCCILPLSKLPVHLCLDLKSPCNDFSNVI